MPDEEDTEGQQTEFLIVGLPENTAIGATLRLLGSAASQSGAERAIRELDPGILGPVALLERKALFVRRAVVESVAVQDPILRKDEQ